jgi:hypothetical protein
MACGGVPDGDYIYVAGMDHSTNSALYMVDVTARILHYVGDAKSASQAVDNWHEGETMEKFHSRPQWYNGRIYVAGLDRSYPNAEFLERRGLKWYVYDPLEDTFTDLSAAEDGGTSTEKGGVRTFAVDHDNGLFYGHRVPLMEVLVYDVVQQQTTVIGRPVQWDSPEYIYTNGFTWLDSRKRLYMSSGNYANGDLPISKYGMVYRYDPAKGTDPAVSMEPLDDFKLETFHTNGKDIPASIELGQLVLDGKVGLMTSDQGHAYLFEDEGPDWTYLGKMPNQNNYMGLWAMNVSLDGRKMYMLTSRPGNEFFELDVESREWTKIGNAGDIDPSMSHAEHAPASTRCG